jgi:hypothetical protein
VIAILFQGPQSPGTIDDHLRAIDAASEEAAASGARVLIAPELSATGFDIGDAVVQRAKPADGPIFAAMSEVSRRRRLMIVYGFAERKGEILYNAVSAVDADRRRVALFGRRTSSVTSIVPTSTRGQRPSSSLTSTICVAGYWSVTTSSFPRRSDRTRCAERSG